MGLADMGGQQTTVHADIGSQHRMIGNAGGETSLASTLKKDLGCSGHVIANCKSHVSGNSRIESLMCISPWNNCTLGTGFRYTL